jgi:hypothetical protein
MLGVPINEMRGWDSVNQMYRDMYKGQVFNRKTSFAVKWRALRSLWIMRKFKSESNAPAQGRAVASTLQQIVGNSEMEVAHGQG